MHPTWLPEARLRVRESLKNPENGGGVRARILTGREKRGSPWKRFKEGRWYAAEWVEGNGADAPDHGRAVRLTDGAVSAIWPAHDVEVRPAADDQWEVRSGTRTTRSRDGQTLEYPMRLAECPEGHVRAIPTRFDAAVVELKCAECRRAYRLVSAGTGSGADASQSSTRSTSS
jgi:hypothetical protein